MDSRGRSRAAGFAAAACLLLALASTAAATQPAEPLILYAAHDPSTGDGVGYTWEVIAPDGGGRTRIGQAAEACWSADGTRIYLRDDRYCRNRLLSVRPDGTDLRLELEMRLGDAAVQMSPDGRSLLFLRRVGDVDCQLTSAGFDVELVVSGLDGTARYVLTGGQGTWAPDGQSIAVAEGATSASPAFIRITDLTAQTLRTLDLPKEVETVRHVSWGTSGSIAFDWAPPPGPTFLSVVSLHDGVTKTITGADSDVLEYAWSPDGTELAYADGAQIPWRTWVVDVATRERRLLTPSGTEDFAVRWSSDGRRLAITRSQPGDVSPWIVVVDRDVAHPHALAPGQSPMWRPRIRVPDGALAATTNVWTAAGALLLLLAAVLFVAPQRTAPSRVTGA